MLLQSEDFRMQKRETKMQNPHLVLASNPITEDLVDRVATSLLSHGFKITRFKSGNELRDKRNVLSDADVLVADGHISISSEMLQCGEKLRAIIAPTTGTEGIDEQAASEMTILVGNGHIPENHQSMAEAIIMLMLVSCYDLHGAERMLRENLDRPSKPHATMLRGKTIGLIGFGQIGNAIAERLKSWDVKIQAAVRRQPDHLPPHVMIVPLEDLVRSSDIVIVAASLNSNTRNMLSRNLLRMTKQGAILINAARGGIVDEDALLDLANEGHFRRVAMDVFATEPLPSNSPLRSMRNAILTPHIVGHTRESIGRFPIIAVENVLAVMAGQLPRYVRNPEVVPRWQQRWGGKSII